MSVNHFHLTDLQYSKDRKGPFALYIYGKDGYHRGAQWFRDNPKHPDEIPSGLAHSRAFAAVSSGQEVRICDVGDMLVFHARGGKVVFGENFWHEIASAIPQADGNSGTTDETGRQR